jgi:predicted transcriptional regulator
MKKVTIHTDGFEGFRKRALERARKLDRGEPIEPEHSITLGPSAMKVLTDARIRVFKCVRAKNAISIPSLATTLKRPREAVSRDVTALKRIGLVDVKPVANPGHGRISMVTPLVRKVLVEV